MKFYICNHCKNIITFADFSGVPVVCCGEKMQELVPGAVDAAAEKHVPVITVDKNDVTVAVGSVTHPMSQEHSIRWIALETKEGEQRKALTPDGEPAVRFRLSDGDQVVAAYAYCNLHGLWMSTQE